MNIRIEEVQLLGNRILIKPDPIKVHEIVSVGGLVTASGKQISNENGQQSLENLDPPTGVVIRAGLDCKILGEGDRVLFSPFSGKRLKFREGDTEQDYILLTEVEPVLRIK